MKKIIPILLILLLASGCVPTRVNIQGSTTAAKQSSEVPEDYSSLVELKEYSCTQANFFMFYVMTIKNNSDKMLSADLNVTALDKDGDPLGGNNCSVKVIAPGQTACAWTTFDTDYQKITKFEHNLNLKEVQNENVYKDLELKTNKTSDGAAVSIKNNGSITAKSVYADAIFLKEGKMVGFDDIQCSDNDSEVKPGQTMSGSGRCANGSFDDILVYLNCR